MFTRHSALAGFLAFCPSILLAYVMWNHGTAAIFGLAFVGGGLASFAGAGWLEIRLAKHEAQDHVRGN